MVEANQPHDTTPPLYHHYSSHSAPFEKWEIFMPHPVHEFCKYKSELNRV